jgi:hypothetical protein
LGNGATADTLDDQDWHLLTQDLGPSQETRMWVIPTGKAHESMLHDQGDQIGQLGEVHRALAQACLPGHRNVIPFKHGAQNSTLACYTYYRSTPVSVKCPLDQHEQG